MYGVVVPDGLVRHDFELNACLHVRMHACLCACVYLV